MEVSSTYPPENACCAPKVLLSAGCGRGEFNVLRKGRDGFHTRKKGKRIYTQKWKEKDRDGISPGTKVTWVFNISTSILIYLNVILPFEVI